MYRTRLSAEEHCGSVVPASEASGKVSPARTIQRSERWSNHENTEAVADLGRGRKQPTRSRISKLLLVLSDEPVKAGVLGNWGYGCGSECGLGMHGSALPPKPDAPSASVNSSDGVKCDIHIRASHRAPGDGSESGRRRESAISYTTPGRDEIGFADPAALTFGVRELRCGVVLVRPRGPLVTDSRQEGHEVADNGG